MSTIFFDGKFVGDTADPEKLVRDIREKRRAGVIPYEVNVVYHRNLDEVRILSESGRVRRPLIVVERGVPKLTKELVEKLKKGEINWSELVKTGVVEYLDSEEEENSLIALDENELTPDHTHIEMDPAVILGFSASFIPFPEFNRGDRVNYGAKMVGQSIGIFATNFLSRVDTKSNVMIYPQRPLVQTHAYDVIPYNTHPNGNNLIIAVASFDGYNMEDSIVINAGSLQKGVLWSYMYRSYEAEQKRYLGGQEDIIAIPEAGVRGYAGEDSYKHLPEDGISNPETILESDQVIIGRVSPLRFLGTMDKFVTGLENIRETSLRLRHGDHGVVDRVFITDTTDGTKLIKVAVRDMKVPEIGDKLASRHGQKGVIALVVPSEDMPFTESGIVPDIIFNPHGIPSRMTMGQLLEIIAGKVAALTGKYVNASAFSPTPENELRNTLVAHGFRNDGKEIMYDGRTGKRFDSQIFIGSTFYQKLDHLVSNKIHARSRGPVTLLTKQPTEGRSKEGGLRLGEMEKDCLIAHGASLVLKERFDSDKTTVCICTLCGLVSIQDRVKNKKICPIHGESKIVDVEMSYAFKLMLDELKSMLIYPKIVVDENLMKVSKLEFGIVSPEMVKSIAAAKLTKTELYDQEGYPIEGGLMDPRLGVIDPGVRCRTCGGNVGDCHGHFGYLELTKPIIHVHYSKIVFALLKMFCHKCVKMLVDPKDIEKARGKKMNFKELVTMSRKKCPHCNTEQKKFKFIKPYTFVEGARTLNFGEVREMLEKISQEDLDVIGLKVRPEWLVLTLMPIPPVTVRPSITLETGERSEDDLTHKLVDIVRINDRLKENIDLGAPDFILEDLWELLQYHISTYFDNELSGVPPARHRSGRVLKTLSQRLKTKEGRFRGNLAGKRVNFSARTVISPDPMIDIDEVGVPEVIAKELTMPVKVNESDLEELKKLVLNGSEIWPGANYVIRPDGRRKKITDLNKSEIATEIAPGYIVERHLQNGDIVIFNRQPSLHRMSLMGHKVKVMPFKTFRMNLSATTPYNADFDGDEMNLHVPQTEEAKVEVENLMMVPKHIRSPRFSGPVIGAIRDHITGSYLLTQDNVKLSRKEFTQLVRAVDQSIELPDKEHLTGKEVFSTFLPKGFSLEFKSNTGESVVIENGRLLKGAIDKVAIGAEAGKIIDKMEKVYGGEATKKFIYNVTRLAINYLMLIGFSISLSDQDLPENAKKDIKEIIETLRKDVDDTNKKYERGELKLLVGRSPKESLDHIVKTILRNGLNDVQKVLEKYLKDNFTLAMVRSGARGSVVNIVQTAAMVGQEMVMGERIEKGYYQRTFPHFKPGTLSLEATGFVSRGFKDGVTPFEFFFDAINSRESLMDKSLKTRHSGYMERRLVGALQDLKVEYDGTVRDSANRIVQFVPGEDGLDPSKIESGGINVREIADKFA
ncbi:MAG: DNA-directed RNA polymerase subunit A' [Candidatus Aenigmarchaeota archaeon]|nr:DNA-directed RNA polymerase subunit A' [Candidatus Aenigmarchaeota archaeon]